MTTGRVVVYTALFGGYDTLREPPVSATRCDFICFTDDPSLTSRTWRIVHVSPTMAPAMMNRHIKMHPHLYVPEYESSLYVDANLRIVRDPAELVDRHLTDAVCAAPRHQSRACVYDEIAVCVRSGKADPVAARAQAERYRLEGYPAGNGLTENRVLLRRHRDPAVRLLMEAWWAELQSGISRDQASLQVVAWRLGVPVLAISEDVVCGEHFIYQPHRHDRLWIRFKVHVLIALKQVLRRPKRWLGGAARRPLMSR